MAKIMTFRTELSCDNERVPALLKIVGAVQVKRPSHLYIDEEDELVFSIEVPDSCEIEDLRKRMKLAIKENINELYDLHRCYQTLNEGYDTDEEWYKKNN